MASGRDHIDRFNANLRRWHHWESVAARNFKNNRCGRFFHNLRSLEEVTGELEAHLGEMRLTDPHSRATKRAENALVLVEQTNASHYSKFASKCVKAI